MLIGSSTRPFLHVPAALSRSRTEGPRGKISVRHFQEGNPTFGWQDA
jgi:hypothetical protein